MKQRYYLEKVQGGMVDLASFAFVPLPWVVRFEVMKARKEASRKDCSCREREGLGLRSTALALLAGDLSCIWTMD